MPPAQDGDGVRGRSPRGVMDLAAAVAPTTLARQRTLAMAAPLAPLFPDGALVRGRAVSCQGAAATSLALALAAEATAAGAWLAVVDVPWLGVEAAGELGIPLERLVRVDPGPERSWADLVGAVLDGFELVITRMPRHLSAGLARRVQARLQAREAVMITIGAAGTNPVDLTLEATTPRWEGIEQGWGCLRGRRTTIVSTGRRVPRPRHVDVWLPGPGGKVTATPTIDTIDTIDTVDAVEVVPVLRSAG